MKDFFKLMLNKFKLFYLISPLLLISCLAEDSIINMGPNPGAPQNNVADVQLSSGTNILYRVSDDQTSAQAPNHELITATATLNLTGTEPVNFVQRELIPGEDYTLEILPGGPAQLQAQDIAIVPSLETLNTVNITFLALENQMPLLEQGIDNIKIIFTQTAFEQGETYDAVRNSDVLRVDYQFLTQGVLSTTPNKIAYATINSQQYNINNIATITISNDVEHTFADTLIAEQDFNITHPSAIIDANSIIITPNTDNLKEATVVFPTTSLINDVDILDSLVINFNPSAFNQTENLPFSTNLNYTVGNAIGAFLIKGIVSDNYGEVLSGVNFNFQYTEENQPSNILYSTQGVTDANGLYYAVFPAALQGSRNGVDYYLEASFNGLNYRIPGNIRQTNDYYANRAFRRDILFYNDQTKSKVASSPSSYTAGYLNRTNSTLYSWGRNDNGQAGISQSESGNLAEFTLVGNDIIDVAYGTNHILVVRENGNVQAMGLGDSGKLGNNSIADSTTEFVNAGAGLVNFVKVSAGTEHSVALDNTGRIWTWGSNERYQQGITDSTQNLLEPTLLELNNSNVRFVQISAGTFHTLALSTTGEVWSWGDNTNGQLGHGNNNTTYNQPDVINPDYFGNLPIAQISAGYKHNNVVTADHNVYTWGLGVCNELGQNNITYDFATSQSTIDYSGSFDAFLREDGPYNPLENCLTDFAGVTGNVNLNIDTVGYNELERTVNGTGDPDYTSVIVANRPQNFFYRYGFVYAYQATSGYLSSFKNIKFTDSFSGLTHSGGADQGSTNNYFYFSGLNLYGVAAGLDLALYSDNADCYKYFSCLTDYITYNFINPGKREDSANALSANQYLYSATGIGFSIHGVISNGQDLDYILVSGDNRYRILQVDETTINRNNAIRIDLPN